MNGHPVTIKAIETTYAGCRFRSRLEARWAVLLDHLKIQWQYEAQGYAFDGRHYLPDFYLPHSGAHLEVKGTDVALAADIERLQQFVVAADTELIICGDIPAPHPARNAPVFHALAAVNGKPVETHAILLGGVAGYAFAVLTGHAPCSPPCTSTKSGTFSGILPAPEVLAAYAAARSARFEYGQTPTRRTVTPVDAQPSPTQPAGLRLALLDRVRHDRYGDGTVIRLDGEGNRTIATISFDHHETVRLMLIGGLPITKIPSAAELLWETTP